MNEMEETQAPVIREDVRFVGELAPLFGALAKAQLGFQPIDKGSTATVEGKEGKRGYTFDYAGLDVVIAATLPSLNAQGLTLLQFPNGNELATVLAHSSGSFIQSTCLLPEWKGSQGFGGVVTYFRRYCWLSIIGAFPADEDDDSNEASGNQATITQRPRATPPATRPAAKESPGLAQGAVTAQTKTRVWDLAQKAGFNTAELEDFSKKHQCGALGGLSELNGLRLVDELGKLQVRE